MADQLEYTDPMRSDSKSLANHARTPNKATPPTVLHQHLLYLTHGRMEKVAYSTGAVQLVPGTVHATHWEHDSDLVDPPDWCVISCGAI